MRSPLIYIKDHCESLCGLNAMHKCWGCVKLFMLVGHRVHLKLSYLHVHKLANHLHLNGLGDNQNSVPAVIFTYIFSDATALNKKSDNILYLCWAIFFFNHISSTWEKFKEKYMNSDNYCASFIHWLGAHMTIYRSAFSTLYVHLPEICQYYRLHVELGKSQQM